MGVKLLTIGDSISQGFISGAAADPSIAYSTLISNAINNVNYNSVRWPTEYKLKYDLEAILREIERSHFKNIPIIKIIPILRSIDKILNKSEEYFEIGSGKVGNPIPGAPTYYHNLSIEGMDIADTWLVTPRLCKRIIERDKANNRNNLFKSASSPFYRNAFRVLNPQSTSHHMDKSAISWLEFISKKDGIENIIIWLGSNNALGTIFDLEIIPTTGDGNIHNMHRELRQKYNLWSVSDFETEYSTLLEKVISALRDNKEKICNVYIGNIPLITISPSLKGFGDTEDIDNPDIAIGGKVMYFENYTHIHLSEKAAQKYKKFMTKSDAITIDKTILSYNEIIKKLVEDKSKKASNINFTIVDLCTPLTKMAYKRNHYNPKYEFPEYFNQLGRTLTTEFYCTDNKKIVNKGGIFSLDGVHPSAVGQGLIAYEFLKKMNNNNHLNNLNWDEIFSSDSLLTDPIDMNYWIKNRRFRHLFIDAIMAIKSSSAPLKRLDILNRLKY